MEQESVIQSESSNVRRCLLALEQHVQGQAMIYAPLCRKPPDLLQCKYYLCSMEGGGMPKSCYSGCHRICSSLSALDLHRPGKFQRKLRRCLTEQEMGERGMVWHEKGWWKFSAFERALSWSVSENAQEAL